MKYFCFPYLTAWIERRSPQGERGLKLWEIYQVANRMASLPSGGAWVEIRTSSDLLLPLLCRSPQGERGLKFAESDKEMRDKKCRSP